MDMLENDHSLRNGENLGYWKDRISLKWHLKQNSGIVKFYLQLCSLFVLFLWINVNFWEDSFRICSLNTHFLACPVHLYEVCCL